MKKLSVSIIGTGLIGQKRAEAIIRIQGFKLYSAFDINETALKTFVKKYNCIQAKNIEEIIDVKTIDLVILAIPHQYAAEIAPKIIKYKNLLLEKPVGRNLKETTRIVGNVEKYHHLLFAGFNCHYYPHIKLLIDYIEQNKLGQIISSSFNLGHASYPGYEKTWKMNKELCGGGVILDPGIHMIDLMISIFDVPSSVDLSTNSLGWQMAVEDEAFLIFKFNNGSISQHHYSLNLAQNTLFIEVVGSKGIVRITGRGGNYGNMKFEFTPRWFWKTNQKIVKEDFGSEDNSFYDEMVDIKIKLRSKKFDYVQENNRFLKTMQLIDQIYNGR
ncbi:hypothetical protein A3C23_01690 [Candidatus Roizmanbacteria bacterium RIFCSPHIGHO2_02_FULL_37_13b]|uniref:Gfo/Idh/MocA-like oxidoreductase N-terminal domain-containing protein n=1 Tax=Candidatus Roizmanbacteria bacterium RIFCSPLOWO2_02_FULL_36_11 TaxID=1802071 RepID=A0A1F7JCV7_9BACT|nr:MAG: hypothetical protein A3C23_01690 [Candidatus Roizmanbacteria bacterium RIFCSPHIGHO2_02_FULL_37_13b]OGK53449.1 MAG: hypothetical protein A3H78_02850 [Candidatus Roizmanbacteria bacterium RIFCSPLOWO2_02_FULL_36_11]